MKNRWIVPIAFLPLLGLVPMQAAGMEGTVMTTACLQPGAAAEKLLSPDGRICLTYSEVQGNGISFNLSYTGKQGQTEVMTLPYTGMQTRKGRGAGLRLERVDKPVHISENYTMLTGKRKVCSNEAEEYLFHFTDSLGKPFDMRVRLYDDGIAFRYELPGLDKDTPASELTTYRIAEGTRRWMQKFNLSYEDFFPMSETGEGENRHWGYPALIQAGEDVWALLSEADIDRMQSASSLMNDVLATDYRVVPAENDREITGDWHTPWRVAIVGSLKDVTESTLVTDVSRPNRLKDTSWIRPGSVSWIYWAYNRGSRDYQLVKQYIDMAAELKLPYVLIDWEWDIMGNGGTIEDALKYAAERNVRTLLWYNSSTAWTTNGAGGPLFKLNAPENREKEFAWLEEHGVAGVKIDFFEGDTEPTMEYCQDLLESAARHKLMVNFHGATIPRGWQRTYPNLMSVEAVYGAEWYNNAPVLTDKAAAHNATLPFTRNVVGPMDYTPCTFSDSQHPHITSHAHELALPVVFESGLQHWADKPESYLAQPEAVKTFMGQLPVAWDETRLVSGYPGDHVIMARRSGKQWYVGALNGKDTACSFQMDWSFLKEGRYRLILFEDSGDKASPWKITEVTVDKGSLPGTLDGQPRGGFVAVVQPE